MSEQAGAPFDEAVADAARRLYAVPLADFVASRKALAAEVKAAVAAELDAKEGATAAKTVLALRKPTLTAWAMNLVSQGEDTQALADLVGLGARMRAAQSRLDTSALTAVRGERDAALTAYIASVASAAEGEGGSLSASARDKVRATAIAALADASAADALASGQLTRALSYSGFGEVDLSGAVGVTSSGSIMSVLRGGGEGVPEPSSETGTAGDDAATTDDGASAEDDADDDDELSEEELAAAVAAARAAKAQAKARARAEAEVADAEAEMARAQQALKSAEEAARAARRSVLAVQERLDSARAQLASSLSS